MKTDGAELRAGRKPSKADLLTILRPCARSGPGLGRDGTGRPNEAHKARLPVRFDHLARRSDS